MAFDTITSMVPSRRPWKPRLHATFWKSDKEKYRADREELLAAVAACGRSSDELRSAMGDGWRLYVRVLEGDSLTLREAWFVDTMIAPVRPLPPLHTT